MNLGSWSIDDNLTFVVNTHVASSGAESDADSVPSYRVYEDETATPLLTGSMATLDGGSTTGHYSEQIALTSANGFERGKCYNIRTNATVSGIQGSVVYNFQIEAPVDLAAISGDATAADNLELDYDGTGLARANSTIGTVTAVTNQVTADMTAISGDSVAADNLEADYDGTGYTKTNSVVGTVTDVTNQVTADVTAISGDTTAADNLELMYDGTGYTDDTAPASRAQVSQFSTGSAAISVAPKSAPSGFVITTGTGETNDEDSTHELDGILHSIQGTGGGPTYLDVYYEFTVGGNGVPVEIIWDGYAQGNNDTVIVEAYNWDTSSWIQIGTIDGSAGTTVARETFITSIGHVGTGANIGDVRVRFTTTDTGVVLATDRILCSYSVVFQSVGYANGAVWIDTVGGTAGTESYVNGVADNPVSTLADALTILSNVGLSKVYVTPGSSITFTNTRSNETWEGLGWTCALGGQELGTVHIVHAKVSGACTSSSGEVHIMNSHLDSISLGGDTHLSGCHFENTITLTATGDYIFENCDSEVAGASAPTIDMGVAVGASNLAVRNFAGGLTISNLASGDVVSLDGTFGTITLNGADAQVEIRGIAKAVVNNLTGSPTVNDDSLKPDDVVSILADTSELQGDWADGGRLDLILDELTTQGDTNESKLDTIDGVVDDILVDTADMQPKLGTPAGADMSADIAAIKAETSLIVADTNELQTDWANGGRLDLILDARASQSSVDTIDGIVDNILVDTGTTLPASLTAIETDTQDIQSRLPAALVSGKMDSDVTAINSNTTAAANLALSAGQIVTFTVDTGTFSSTTTQFECDDVTEATADHYNGRIVIFTSGALAGQATSISDYSLEGSNGRFTVVALTEAPANDVTGIIL